MPRLTLVDPDAAESPALRELFLEIAGLRGRVLNLHRAVAIQPAALSAFMAMSRYVRDESALSPQLREFLTLAVGFALGSDYEIGHHLPIARRVGVEAAKLDALAGGAKDSAAYTPAERALVVAVHEVVDEHQLTDNCYAELRRHFSEPELVDVALTVGWYLLCGTVISTFALTGEDVHE